MHVFASKMNFSNVFSPGFERALQTFNFNFTEKQRNALLEMFLATVQTKKNISATWHRREFLTTTCAFYPLVLLAEQLAPERIVLFSPTARQAKSMKELILEKTTGGIQAMLDRRKEPDGNTLLFHQADVRTQLFETLAVALPKFVLDLVRIVTGYCSYGSCFVSCRAALPKNIDKVAPDVTVVDSFGYMHQTFLEALPPTLVRKDALLFSFQQKLPYEVTLMSSDNHPEHVMCRS
jgi:hypothetical protein